MANPPNQPAPANSGRNAPPSTPGQAQAQGVAVNAQAGSSAKGAAVQAPTGTGGGGSGLDEDSETKLVQMKKDVEKLSTLVTSLKNTVDKTNEKMENLDETIANLASVYEVVTNQINPFLDHSANVAAPAYMPPPTPPVVQSIPLSAPELPLKPAETRVPEKKTEPAPPTVPPSVMPLRQVPIPGPGVSSEVQPFGSRPVVRHTMAPPLAAEETPLAEPGAEVRTANGRAREYLLMEIDMADIQQVQNVLDWVAFLLLKVGHTGLPKLLEYYRNVGWISNPVKDRLEDYAKGLEIEEEPKKAMHDGLVLADQKRSLELFYKIVESQEH
jgi:hypothetical protein